MPWWGWIVMGVGLLALELALIEADFFLVFLGLSAAVTGFLIMLGLELPVWGQFSVFALLAVLSMVFLRKPLLNMVKANGQELRSSMIGASIQVLEDLPPKATTRLEFQGSEWTVRNDGNRVIAAMDYAQINSVDGIVLSVSADSETVMAPTEKSDA